MALLCNRFCFPGPNELDQVMGIICSMGPRWKKQTTALHIFLVIQVEVLLSSRTPRGNPAGFDDGLLPQGPFCMRDLLDVFLAAAGPKKASSSSPNPADRRAILPLLRLAAEVGQNNIPQVEGRSGVCRHLLHIVVRAPFSASLGDDVRPSSLVFLQFQSSKG